MNKPLRNSEYNDVGRRLPLVDLAYREIKRRIITIAYPPGASLNELQISEELGIGRTPVHHALHRLALEALVDIAPRKGVRVRPIIYDEIAEIVEARLVIEPYCAAQASQRISRAQLEAPLKLLRSAEFEIAGDSRAEVLMELDTSFHSWINKAGNNTVLAEIQSQLQDRSARFWFLTLSDRPHIHQVHEEHVAILTAIAARDPEAARQASEAHIKSFRQTILRVI